MKFSRGIFMSIVQQLQNINVVTNTGVNPKYKVLLKKHPDVLQCLFKHTPWVEDQSEQSYRERIYCVLNHITRQPVCKHCGVSPVSFITNGKKRNQYFDFCSLKCSNNAQQTKSKKQQTWLDNFGVDNPSKSEFVSEQKQQTCLQNFGTSWPMQSQQVNQLRKQTLLQRYGSDNVMRNEQVANKNIQQRKQSQWYKDVVNSTYYQLLNNRQWLVEQHHKLKNNTHTIAEQLGVSPSYVQQYLHIHNIEIKYHYTSNQQKQIVDWLQQVTNTEIVVNDRRTLPKGKELDIHLPQYNLAVEYDGLYWHSASNEQDDDKYRHVNKTQLCEQQGIRLVHIFENEWIDKPQIVKSRLSGILQNNAKIYARNCTVQQLSKQQAHNFFNQTHIQGTATCSVAYGLFSQGQLVAAMSFAKARYSKQYKWELIRFSCQLFTNVVGAGGKLFKYFVKQNKPQSVVSYADKRWAHLTPFYNKLGFNYSHNSKPNYFYFRPQDGCKLHSRVSFQKHKLPQKLEHFDPDLTEIQNMFNNGYRRIWDCGNQVWVWTDT